MVDVAAIVELLRVLSIVTWGMADLQVQKLNHPFPQSCSVNDRSPDSYCFGSYEEHD